jgi:hypothetical protein
MSILYKGSAYYHFNFKTYDFKTGLSSAHDGMWLLNCTVRQSTTKTLGYLNIMCIPLTPVTEYMHFKVDNVLYQWPNLKVPSGNIWYSDKLTVYFQTKLLLTE